MKCCRSPGVNIVKCVNTKLITVSCKPEKLAKIFKKQTCKDRECVKLMSV